MNIVDNRLKVAENAQLFLSNIRNSDTLYLFGLNKYGKAFAEHLESLGFKIKGFVNDFTEQKEFHGYPVLKSIALGLNCKIINCVVEGRTIDVENHIVSLNPSAHCNYFSLQLAYKNELPEVDFMSDSDSILNHIPQYAKIYEQLGDQQSKLEFESLTNFRLNRDIDFLRNFKFRLNEQYFEKFIDFGTIKTFVDGGSFDGATSIEFIKIQSSYEQIFVFEPNDKSIIQTKENLKNHRNIEFFNKGLWSSTTSLRFDSNSGSASKIDELAVDVIEVTSLDETIEKRVDFIKLDIEGAEKEAIMGASQIIIKNKPKLAICVYHNQSDFIEIPQLVLKLNPNYEIYLRHYTQGVFETVMYFI